MPFTFGPDFHSILSLVGDGVVSTDQNGRIILFNRAAEEIFGYGLDDVLGRSIELLIPMRFHDRHREDFKQFLSSLVPLRRSMGAEREVMGRRKDGSELAIEATLSRQMISGHPISTVVVRDISDRKKVEVHRQTVANEVAHRLQNTMAVVTSIVTLTARSAKSVVDFRDVLLGRFAAISRTNGFLIDGSNAAADLRDLLGSLVVHELTTNAVKYGSLSGPGGSLKIDWHVPGKGKSILLKLTWREAGGPAVSFPSKRGFGTGLISRSLGRHGGSAELAFSLGGVECEITVPLT